MYCFCCCCSSRKKYSPTWLAPSPAHKLAGRIGLNFFTHLPSYLLASRRTSGEQTLALLKLPLFSLWPNGSHGLITASCMRVAHVFRVRDVNAREGIEYSPVILTAYPKAWLHLNCWTHEALLAVAVFFKPDFTKKCTENFLSFCYHWRALRPLSPEAL